MAASCRLSAVWQPFVDRHRPRLLLIPSPGEAEVLCSTASAESVELQWTDPEIGFESLTVPSPPLSEEAYGALKRTTLALQGGRRQAAESSSRASCKRRVSACVGSVRDPQLRSLAVVSARVSAGCFTTAPPTQDAAWRWRARLAFDALEYPVGLGAPLAAVAAFWLLLELKADGACPGLSYWAVFAPLLVPPLVAATHVALALRPGRPPGDAPAAPGLDPGLQPPRPPATSRGTGAELLCTLR